MRLLRFLVATSYFLQRYMQMLHSVHKIAQIHCEKREKSCSTALKRLVLILNYEKNRKKRGGEQGCLMKD